MRFFVESISVANNTKKYFDLTSREIAIADCFHQGIGNSGISLFELWIRHCLTYLLLFRAFLKALSDILKRFLIEVGG